MSNKLLSPELKKQFLNLVCQLSPENLHADGEISHTQAKKKYNSLMREWKRLEAIAGRKVEEFEAYESLIK